MAFKGAFYHLAGYIPSLSFIAALSPRINTGLAASALASNEQDGALQHPGPRGGFWDSYNGDAVTVQLAGLRNATPSLGDLIVADDLGG